jgi:hypothetical protein
MDWKGRALAAAVLCAAGALAGAGEQRPAQGVAPAATDFGKVRASADAQYAVRWVLEMGDNRGRPFAIVDKKEAKLYVFDGTGRLEGGTSVLLGMGPGDHSVPGIGQRELSSILPFEATTPAGRFVSRPGRNLTGDQVIWADYNAGFAIHRLRPGRSEARRARSLASATTRDNRASLGCVVVPAAFYEKVVLRVLGGTRGVVYVLPETRSVRDFFNAD